MKATINLQKLVHTNKDTSRPTHNYMIHHNTHFNSIARHNDNNTYNQLYLILYTFQINFTTTFYPTEILQGTVPFHPHPKRQDLDQVVLLPNKK